MGGILLRGESRVQTELEAYAFAGREDLTEIEIPAGIRKVGRYAFYNCRNLKKLYFHSDIRDLGAGVFTGCRKISCLEVTVVGNYLSILREILMELNQQMLVICHGEMEARLWFPEYFEEGVENTPARILEDHVHGSGLMYRNCLVKTGLNYEEYDGRFLYACASESEDLVVRLAFDRLCFPQGLTEEAKKRYFAYLQEHLSCLYRYMAEEKDVRQIQQFLESFTPDKEELQQLIEIMQHEGYAEAVPHLMAYHHQHFAKKRNTFSL